MIWPTQIISYVLAGVAIFGTVAAGVQTVRIAHAHTETAQAVAEMAAMSEDTAAAALAESTHLRAQAEAQASAKNEALDDAHKSTAAAVADARAAVRSADKLRVYAATLARGCAAQPGATATSASAPASAPGDLLPYMLGRIDEAAGAIAEHADRARIAGLACERIHDSLSAEAAP